MRVLPVACVVAAVLAPGTEARADFASDFAALRAELERRRDEDLSGVLDGAGRRQLRAVTGALATLDAGGADLGAEIQAAKKVLKPLRKAFPLDFPVAGGAELGIQAEAVVLDAAFGDLFASLQGQAEALLADLQGDLSSLTPEERERAQRLIDRVEAGLDSIDPADLPRWAAALVRVHRAFGKAERLVGRYLLAKGTVAFTVDGVPFESHVLAFSYSGPSGFNLQARGGTLYEEGAYVLSLQTVSTAFTEGTRAIDAGSFVDGFGPDRAYFVTEGSFTVLSIDEGGHRVSGVFSVTVSTLSPPALTLDVAEIEGVFDIPLP